MEIMSSFRRSHAVTTTLSAPSLAAGHHRPMPLLETPGHSRASLGQSPVGSLLILLGPGVHKAGQRLIEFCQENALGMINTLS